MRITAGLPVIVQPAGLRLRTEAPLDTETLLYLEQQVDRGDAICEPLTPDLEVAGGECYTHRLISQTGGWFWVRAEEQPAHALPEIGLPVTLGWLRNMVEELDGIVRQQQTLLAANRLLEERCCQLAATISSLETHNEQLERHLSP